MCKKPSSASGTLGCRIFLIRLSIRSTLLRLHTLPQTLAQDRTGGGRILFNFGQLSENTSSIFVCVRRKWSLMKRAGNLATKGSGTKVSLR
jgi:hypothetical protein